ncbi:MAG: hypothetical protein JWN32_3900 [Solirubrobacterales bacterium]|nr:hypothetical protein [Solirubrobacterales bacterium]
MESATITRRPPPGAGILARLRAVPLRVWERLGISALIGACLAEFIAYPTYPNYDSYYFLNWGRELVHFQHLSFKAYRASTEHPLAIAFGALLQPFGRVADRILVLITLASFVVLVWGVYRLSRITFTRWVGWAAALLVVSRLDFPSLAIRGYIDVPYLALLVWAAVLEAERPRRGYPVLVLLMLASLMRPEAWLLIGGYFLWVAWPASWRRRLRYLALTAAGPVIWAGLDAAVTGDPLFSLHSTTGLAADLGRNKGISGVPHLLPHYIVGSVKVPVAIAAVVGILIGLWIVPRRVVVPGILLASGILTFVLVGLAGLSTIPRYLVVSQLLLIVFAALAVGGWSLLQPGSLWRRGWMLGAAVVLVYGVVFTATRWKPNVFFNDLAYRGQSHAQLVALLDEPAVKRELRCGKVSVPNHKLIPEVRWALGVGASKVIARSDVRTGWRSTVEGVPAPPRADAPAQRGLALFVLNHAGIQRLIQAAQDDLSTQIPRANFHFVAANGFYAAYARC